jgi:hypothetical protein
MAQVNAEALGRTSPDLHHDHQPSILPAHPQTQWPFRPNVRRHPRTDPSRLSRISYISTLSTQSSSLSSISVDWYSPTPESPESEYLRTPPPPARQVSLADGGVGKKGSHQPFPSSTTENLGLGLQFDPEEGAEDGDEEEDGDDSLYRLDALLARVQELTNDGMKALDLGSTRITSRLPVNMTAARRKLQPSLN